MDRTWRGKLPHLIGDAVSEDIRFDDNISGEPSVEFSTAAFRFAHTLVSSSIVLVREGGTDADLVTMMEAIICGQTSAAAQELDTEIIDDLNFFLETPDGASDVSVAAFNLTRGLKHLLYSYVDLRAQSIADVDLATLDPVGFSIINCGEDV